MKLLCIACLVCSSLWAGALDREAFTFTRYDLKIRIEPVQQRLGARGKISLRNDSAAPQRSLSLQISSTLNWISIRFEGKPVEFVSQIYTSDIDHTGALSEAIIVLPQAVAPKQTIELDIGYEGVIPQDTTRLTRIGLTADEAKHSDWDQIGREFTAVRGVGHVAWYPVATDAVSLSDGNAVSKAIAKWKRREDQTQMKLAFEYSQSTQQAPTELLCNGMLGKAITGDAGGEQNLTLECLFTSLRSTVPTFVVAPYSEVNGKDVAIHYLPDHKAGADDYASALEEVSPLVSKWFGDHRESRDAKARVLDLPDADASPFESDNVLLMPLSGSDTKLLLTAAQQLTFLLFPSPRAWIHAGLASFSQVRLIEEKEGRPAAIAYLKAHLSALVDLEKSSVGRESEGDALIGSADDFRVQTKSMYVWWMVRDIIGASALDAALHNYKADDDNDPRYMEKLIQAESHRDLQWFFDDWVYHDRGLPDFRVASVYPSRLSTGGYMVTITVENLGASGAEIPVTLHMQGSEASDRLIVPAKTKASVRIQTPSLPLDVTLNDGSVPEMHAGNDVYKIESVKH